MKCPDCQGENIIKYGKIHNGKQRFSFSKKIENHIGAIWNFIHHYNASLACS